MMNRLIALVSLFILSACTINPPTVIEPTEVAPAQPIAATRTIPPAFTSTPRVKTPTSTPIPSELVGMDPAYFDGIVVITQYLTYLDLGLYQEAYRLLHPERPNIKSEEDFILGAEKAYQSVEIKTIQPYFIWAENHGLNASGDPENQIRYYVEFGFEGEPGWWPDNEVGLIFSLEMNDNGWRIISQDTIAKTTNQPTPVTPTWIDSEFFDGIIVITEYYTFLDQGLFEESYQLLSSSIHDKQNKDEYIKMAALSFKTVRIVKIQPYEYFAQHQGWKIQPETESEKRFYVQIVAEGEGGMSGSAMNGEIQTLFLPLNQEKNEFKISGFFTSPFLE